MIKSENHCTLVPSPLLPLDQALLPRSSTRAPTIVPVRLLPSPPAPQSTSLPGPVPLLLDKSHLTKPTPLSQSSCSHTSPVNQLPCPFGLVPQLQIVESLRVLPKVKYNMLCFCTPPLSVDNDQKVLTDSAQSLFLILYFLICILITVHYDYYEAKT
jgi:hypothetical protein